MMVPAINLHEDKTLGYKCVQTELLLLEVKELLVTQYSDGSVFYITPPGT